MAAGVDAAPPGGGSVKVVGGGQAAEAGGDDVPAEVGDDRDGSAEAGDDDDAPAEVADNRDGPAELTQPAAMRQGKNEKRSLRRRAPSTRPPGGLRRSHLTLHAAPKQVPNVSGNDNWDGITRQSHHGRAGARGVLCR